MTSIAEVAYAKSARGPDWLYVALLLSIVVSPRVWVGDVLGIGSRFVSINVEDLVVALLVIRWAGRLTRSNVQTTYLTLPQVTKLWMLVTLVFGLELGVAAWADGFTESLALAVLFYLKWIESGVLFIVMQNDLRNWGIHKIRLHIQLLLVIGLGAAIVGLASFFMSGGPQRIVISFVNPNTAGIFYLIFAVLALGYATEKKLFGFTVFTACIMALVVTFSRSAILGGLVAGLVLLLIVPRTKRGPLARIQLIVIIGLALALVYFVIVPAFNTYQATRWLRTIDLVSPGSSFLDFKSDPSLSLRLSQARLGWELFLERPWLGHGFRTLTHTFLDNQYIILLAETGILGVLAFLLYWSSLIRFSFRWRKHWIAASLLAIIAALWATGVGGAVLFIPRIIMMMFFLLVLASVEVRARSAGNASFYST